MKFKILSLTAIALLFLAKSCCFFWNYLFVTSPLALLTTSAASIYLNYLFTFPFQLIFSSVTLVTNSSHIYGLFISLIVFHFIITKYYGKKIALLASFFYLLTPLVGSTIEILPLLFSLPLIFTPFTFYAKKIALFFLACIPIIDPSLLLMVHTYILLNFFIRTKQLIPFSQHFYFFPALLIVIIFCIENSSLYLIKIIIVSLLAHTILLIGSHKRFHLTLSPTCYLTFSAMALILFNFFTTMSVGRWSWPHLQMLLVVTSILFAVITNGAFSVFKSRIKTYQQSLSLGIT
ncbi:MAG: hypothetical protein HQK52_14860 [Oligoflexia bacterium]|nr:hypothetical protein [Oligoflexia bacterium]